MHVRQCSGFARQMCRAKESGSVLRFRKGSVKDKILVVGMSKDTVSFHWLINDESSCNYPRPWHSDSR